jgi:acyl carrier protein
MTAFEVIERETGQLVTADTLIDDLNVDSLELLNLILEIELETGKEIDDARIPLVKTVGELISELK